MNDLNYPQIAGVVYQACSTYDPYLPPLSAPLATSWGKCFEHYQLSLDDLLAGVHVVYLTNGKGYRPLPADIVKEAREVRRERAERESEAERRAREDTRDAELARRNQAALDSQRQAIQ